MSQEKKTYIIYLHETVLQSALRDLATFAGILLLWGFGYALSSVILEVFGLVVGVTMLIARVTAKATTAHKNRMTPAQAKEWLAAKFPEGE